MSEKAKLCVIFDKHDIRKLLLPSGIPDTVQELDSIIRETFQTQGNFTLQYKDAKFGEFFSLTTTAEIKNKYTIKVVFVNPVILTFSEIDQIKNTSPPSDVSSIASSVSSSADTLLLSSPESHGQQSQPWHACFEIPQFANSLTLVIRHFRKEGTLLINPSIKSKILEILAENIYQYCAYPTSTQISAGAEALIQKHPCLREPGSYSGHCGWQTWLKYKMANYRTKLRSLGCPELAVNSVKNKSSADLPPPTGESLQTLENERIALLSEVRKKDNWNIVNETMAKNFSYRRQETTIKTYRIVFIRKYTLLNQIKHEFKRITTIDLEVTFMANLDKYTS
uniref:PB1 domain-containing protein n=1 Tax=Lepisosteus oculatus TaxID=7918 RepID=W5N922_LEPOC